MQNLTVAEFETLKEAWKIWQRIRVDLSSYLMQRNRATGKWTNTDTDYLGGVSDVGIEAHIINAQDDGEWEPDPLEITFEELSDLEARHTKNTLIAEVVEGERQRVQEERQRRVRLEAYEKLKEEFAS